MGLGTSDTVSSIALAMVPPGNVLRTIAEIRRSFWTRLGAASARAYFDYPVLAWLGEPINGATLAGIASRSSIPFELIGFERRVDDVFIRFPAELEAGISRIVIKVPVASRETEFSPGPFEAGFGCYCATLSGLSAPQLPVVDLIAAPPIRVKTYLLAQVELRWVPGPSFASSWATLSSARSSENHR